MEQISIACKVETCLTINSSDVICDNFWVWRADHGKEVGWDKNTSKTGVIVNGDNVTAYALRLNIFRSIKLFGMEKMGKHLCISVNCHMMFLIRSHG